MRYWQPFGAKTTATRTLPHADNQHQWSINYFWSCIFGNQGIVYIFEHTTELLTARIGKNTVYRRNITDSKIINIVHCKTCTNNVLAVEYMILIRHYYQTAKTRALYDSIDGPAGRPADDPPNPDGLVDIYHTLPELTVWVS